MHLKTAIIEFRSMLKDCDGEVPRLTRQVRNRFHLNQQALGELAGLHRNAIIRLENSKCAKHDKWKTTLFFVLLACRNKEIHNDVSLLRGHARKKFPIETTPDNSVFFRDFIRLYGDCNGSGAVFSRRLRGDHGLTQEDLAELLGVDRTAVTHLESEKYKYPERHLADMYFSFLQLREPALRRFLFTLRLEKAKKDTTVKTRKTDSAVPLPPASEVYRTDEPAVFAAAEEGPPPAITVPQEAFFVSAVSEAAKAQAETAPAAGVADRAGLGVAKPEVFSEEQTNLQRYGFRTRQELYNAMRSENENLEEKRRLVLIDDQWTEDLKRSETLKAVRSQMVTVRDKINRELFDRTNNTQAVFMRAANNHKKGLSIAEISQEHNGYLSVPFCRLWEKQGFHLVKYLAWRPTDREVYEIYKDYEPEFVRNTLEYRFRPRKNPLPAVREADMNLKTLLKEWFPQIASEQAVQTGP